MSLQELIAKRSALDAEIQSTRQRERDEELPRLRALVSEYGITAAELFPDANSNRRGPKVGKASANGGRNSPLGLARGVPKYRDPVSGKTWSGFGRRPDWFVTEQSDSFLIPA